MQAVKLRQKGVSYEAIAASLGLAKSTSYVWLKNVHVSKVGREKLQKSLESGRTKGRLVRIDHLKARDAEINARVEKELVRVPFKKECLKLLCSFLYWSEGAKGPSALSFTNSDPSMVKTFLKLLRENFTIDERRLKAILHLHSYHNVQRQVIFWSKITHIPTVNISIYNKANVGKNIREGYPGCIAVRYHDVKVFKELVFYYKLFAHRYGGLV